MRDVVREILSDRADNLLGRILGIGTLKVGTNYANTATLNGRVFELLTAAQVLGEPARASVRAYFNVRYGTTFR